MRRRPQWKRINSYPLLNSGELFTTQYLFCNQFIELAIWPMLDNSLRQLSTNPRQLFQFSNRRRVKVQLSRYRLRSNRRLFACYVPLRSCPRDRSVYTDHPNKYDYKQGRDFSHHQESNTEEKNIWGQASRPISTSRLNALLRSVLSKFELAGSLAEQASSVGESDAEEQSEPAPV